MTSRIPTDMIRDRNSGYHLDKLILQSGTTANRPTSVIVGMPYLDTTLGKPIWVKSISPIVWIDATGATV